MRIDATRRRDRLIEVKECTPLHIAAFNRSTAVVRQLLASNANASALDSRWCLHLVMVMVMAMAMVGQ
jgi:hypothetical protein